MRALVCVVALLVLAAPASALVTVVEPVSLGDGEFDYRVSAADPRTLAAGPRSVVVRRCAGTGSDVSPSGRLVAVPDCGGDAGTLRFLNRRTWSFTGPEVALPATPLAVSWATDRRVLVLHGNNGAVQASVLVVDPGSGRLVARRQLDHTPKEARRVGRHWAVVDSDYRIFSVPEADRDDSVLRIFDARGRQRVVPLGTRILDTGTHSLIAFRGTLYVALGDRVLAVDPDTGRRRSLPVAGLGVLDLLAVSARRIAGDGPNTSGDTVQILARRSGREILRLPGQFGSVNFGAGWATPLRDGLAGYAASGRRLWRTLRGKDVLFDYTVQRIRSYLYVLSSDPEDPGVRVLRARTGRTVYRTTSPRFPVDWDRNGLFDTQVVGDGGDEGDE